VRTGVGERRLVGNGNDERMKRGEFVGARRTPLRLRRRGAVATRCERSWLIEATG
jgi:hypothetical protein